MFGSFDEFPKAQQYRGEVVACRRVQRHPAHQFGEILFGQPVSPLPKCSFTEFLEQFCGIMLLEFLFKQIQAEIDVPVAPELTETPARG